MTSAELRRAQQIALKPIHQRIITAARGGSHSPKTTRKMDSEPDRDISEPVHADKDPRRREENNNQCALKTIYSQRNAACSIKAAKIIINMP
ncbi:hypothetical protein BG74_09230 [Sodalis-like endosymbiont of Proechinophthirus fluctus]|nr:hypothetical protein BG74_09230 [Sodalis-like endosymbiont of Proechinophthirus fluctus]